MPTSIDLSSVVELRSLSDIVETLNDSARGIVERWLIVGATARDLILHHVYHLPISRATIDLDIAVAVPSWVAFEVLQKELLKRGAGLHPRITHRFVMRTWQIDIIPFGGIEESGVIFWPPSNDTKMFVLGFDEASRNALNVTFRAGVTARSGSNSRQARPEHSCRPVSRLPHRGR
jgi:predicted nucleotidyltransferase